MKKRVVAFVVISVSVWGCKGQLDVGGLVDEGRAQARA